MEDKVKQPIIPWKKGHHKDYSHFSIEVKICQGVSGELWSQHDYLSPEDEKIASEVHTKGIEQTIVALFTEAIRKEAYLEAILSELARKGFLKKAFNKESEYEVLLDSVTKVSKGLIDRVVKGAVEDILEMLVNS